MIRDWMRYRRAELRVCSAAHIATVQQYSGKRVYRLRYGATPRRLIRACPSLKLVPFSQGGAWGAGIGGALHQTQQAYSGPQIRT